MGSTPIYINPTRPMISVLSEESLGTSTIGVTANAFSSNAWPTANKAIFIPFVIRQNTLVKKLWTANGSGASQTRDVGIYDEAGTKITSTGSTAGSGTTTLQVYDITDIMLSPGRYYLALVSSGTSNQFFAQSVSARHLPILGILEQTSAFPLPATATFATSAAAYIPVFGLSTVVTV